MSLQVWLPLTKDLRQQGLSNVTATNNGATFNASNGKLGGSYTFDGSDDYISLNGSTLYSTIKGGSYPFSVAMWIYRADATRAILFGDYSLTGAINFNIELTTGHAVRFYWAGSPDKNSSATLMTANDWTHLAITYNGTQLCFYKNGTLMETYSVTLTTKTKTTGSYYLGRDNRTGSTAFNGRMNDFRLYDHCLSSIEVKELAKGLVLHYPLNRNGWGQENLILNSANISVNKLNNALDSRTEYWAANVGQSYVNFVGGEQVILSFDCEMIIRTVPVYFLVYNTNNKGPIQFPNTNAATAINNLNPSVGDTIKLRIKLPVTMIKRDSPSTTNNFIEFYTNYGSNNFYKITNLKLEEGSIATPWCPNSSDTLATTMGLNLTTEYDCSGFCNNGTRIGTFNWTSNTPKYAVSTKFNGTDNAIQTPSLPTMITDKNYTIAVWIYKTVIGSKGYQTIYGGPSGFEIEARNGSANETKFVPWNWGKPMASYELNEWNHCVFVHSDADCKIYLNGEYIATGTAKASNPTGNYFVGAWNTATQQNFDGLMSDFRIYATALSANDVKSLYQNCATIDPDGTIRGQIRS